MGCEPRVLVWTIYATSCGLVRFDLRYLPYASGVTLFSCETRVEPYPDYLKGFFGRSQPLAQHEDIRIIVLPRKPRAFDITAESSAYAGNLVCGDAHPNATVTDKDAAIEFSLGDRLSDLQPIVGVVRPFSRKGTVVSDFYALFRQETEDGLLEFKAGVIRPYSDLHRLDYTIRQSSL